MYPCDRSLDPRQAFKILFQLFVCIGLPIIFVYNIEIESEGLLRDGSSLTISKMLPPPQQTWVHAVDNRRTLLEALQDDAITAIETDLLMGHSSSIDTPDHSNHKIPIMAHPPSTTSDLPMVDFWKLVGSNSTVQKVIKLDFKDPETVQPTLQAIADLKLQTTGHAVIFLNADVLPGPGQRQEGVVTIQAKPFLETCLQYQKQSTARMALSLGYKTQWTDVVGYTPDDVQAMAELIQDYQLVEQEIGVVLALNARLLAKSLNHWQVLLKKYPSIQILAWTGKGEPSISQALVGLIQYHFRENGMAERIGYDCQVSS
jgi:Uncharacterized conserved protein (DUF2181)